jgi:hypothetical protein
MALTLVLRKAVTLGDGGALDGGDRRVTYYEALGHPNYDILICGAGEVWRAKRQLRGARPGSTWEELPGEYASAEEAKAALENA